MFGFKIIIHVYLQRLRVLKQLILGFGWLAGFGFVVDWFGVKILVEEG